MAKSIAIYAASLALVFSSFAANANAQEIRARLDLGAGYISAQGDSIDASLGFAERRYSDAKLRIMLKGGEGPWSYELHSLFNFELGDNVAYNAALAGMFPAAPPPSFFNLTSNIYSATNASFTHTIDRMSLTFTSDNFVVRAGRQALTWGTGMVFRPGDILAPFAPNAIDTSYKPGIDMIYTQYLFENGADLEAVFVPRRAMAGGEFSWDASTLALHSTMQLGDLDGSIILARDREDILLNLSLGGPLGGAAWNAEVGQWFLADGSHPTNFLVNISNSGTIGDKNINYFAEYFHNGFGVAANTPLDSLPISLSTRLATGQLFNTGRDFLALGGTIELMPDLTFTPSLITSLNDGSIFAALTTQWSISDNADLTLSASKGYGKLGSEFGGRETSAGSGIYVRPPEKISLRFTSYF